MSVQFWGEPAEGRWTLSIGDDSHDTNVYVVCLFLPFYEAVN